MSAKTSKIILVVKKLRSKLTQHDIGLDYSSYITLLGFGDIALKFFSAPCSLAAPLMRATTLIIGNDLIDTLICKN